MSGNPIFVSRRWFIGGASAFGALGAFGGNRFVRLPGFRKDGVPKLRFGVLSDIHIKGYDNSGKKLKVGIWNQTVRHALEWYRDQGVDAVVIAGDLADNSLIEELQFLADTWEAVFPGDRASDGRKVERIFVYGNHDEAGNNFAVSHYPDLKERAKYALLPDYGGWWERIFHEEYRPIYRKDVKGYAFIGAHWDHGEWRPGGKRVDPYALIGPYLAEHGKDLDPNLPFFYIQHPHPKDTCYGPWAWGHDTGASTAALLRFPNAIAISGHSHYSLTDERSVWQGAFTSVGAASLWFVASPENQRAPAGYENSNAIGSAQWRTDAMKMMPAFHPWGCRQGMLWSVYDDCIVMKRREFQVDLDVGDDWVLPLPAAEPKPFAFAARAKRIAAPEFPEGARITVEPVTAKNRGGRSRDGKERVEAVEQPAYGVVFPAVRPVNGARVMDFEVTAENRKGKTLVKHVLCEGFHQPIGHEAVGRPGRCVFSAAELPDGEFRVRVTPRNCFGKCGRALVSDWIARS